MKALVTGGAGFIGSHLAERLLENDWQVTVVDNISTGSEANIKHLVDRKGFRFLHGDIRDSALMLSAVEQCDAVFHLAAAVGVKLIAEQPVYTIETNIDGTEALLELCNKFAKKILIASSSEVYGKNEAVPFHEDDNIVLGSTRFPRWAYACTKAIDEFLGLAFHQQYGLPVIIARFFNTIGPRQTGRYGMVVPRFIQRALSNQPLQIHGSGRQKRCFCYVTDVVQAVVSLMHCEQAAGNVYNIGSTEEISIDALADKVIKISGSNSAKEYLPYEQAYGRPMEDMMRRVPDIQRIQQAIQWSPRLNLRDALELIIQSKKAEMKL